jgi:hypothetical protein
MSTQHLDDHELDLALCGEQLPEGAAAHVQRCVHCRQRLETLTSLLVAGRQPDPDGVSMERVRVIALTRWAADRGHGSLARGSIAGRIALAAAALLAVAVSLPIVIGPGVDPLDVSSVLEEVDRVLDRDPLATFASEGIVQFVLPDDEPGAEGSTS